jgi:aminopeptidase-like protein
VCRNLKPKGEPRLGKRGLYDLIGGERVQDSQLALLWVLNQSDGRHDLLAIAEKSGLPFSAVRDAATALLQTDLLEEEPRR